MLASRIEPRSGTVSDDAGQAVGGPVTTVVLLDDHEMVRQGLAELLDAQPDISVVGQAADADTALELVDRHRPTMAILDVRLPVGNGIDVCRRIAASYPEVRSLILTSVDDDRTIIDSANAGAAGLVLKRARADDLLAAIRKVASGVMLLDAATVHLHERHLYGTEEGAIEQLTPQERRLFEMLGEGCSNRQIADAMGLTEKTVKNYASNVLAKLGMVRRTQAAALAARLDERRHTGG